MRPVSQKFLRAIRGSHRTDSRARVVTDFQSGTQPTGGTFFDEISGNVVSDARILGEKEVRGAVVTSSLDLEVNGERLWPNESDDLLAPYGNEIFVERGIAFGNGIVEWVSLGYFRIDTIDQEEAPDGPIRITGSDRMSGIQDGRFTRPKQFIQGTTLGDIVDELVKEIYPDAIIDWDDNSNLSTLGRSQVFEKDRFDALSNLVTSIGKMMFWDYRGHLVIQDVPDLSVAVYDVNAGENGVLTSLSRDLSRDGVYNGVVAAGEAADTEPPVTAIAVDMGANSPTNWEGRFGKVPRFYSSPFITTEAQAQSAAEAVLRQSLGLPYNVNFGTIPNVALEPLDVVSVRYPKIMRFPTMREELHVLRQITYPLDNQEMTAMTREQKLVTVEFLTP